MGVDFLSLYSDFLNYPPLPELMQGAGMAVLTVLVSFAIGIFIHHLGDGERNGNFFDLHIALDYVWRFKASLIVLVIVVISPFFLGLATGLTPKNIVFIIWAFSLLALFLILLRLYNWVKGDKDDFRASYLAEFIKSSKEKIDSWGDFWSTDKNIENHFIENRFFVIFSNELDSLFQSSNQDDWETILKLLEGFSSKIEKRNKTFLLLYPEFFSKILEWHFIVWQKEYSKFVRGGRQTKLRRNLYVFRVSQVLERIIKYVTESALSGTIANTPVSYFESLEKHVNKYQSESITGEESTYYYLERLPVYADYFDMVSKSPDSYDIWREHFPKSWKITISSLKKNKISRIWNRRFFEWLQSRMWKNEKGRDEAFGKIVGGLFRDIIPSVWVEIIIFAFNFRSVREVIEGDANYGYIDLIHFDWGDKADRNFVKRRKIQFKNTLKLTAVIFGKIFTKKNLDKWLDDLGNFQYPKDSEGFRRKQRWEKIFKSLRTLITKKNN